MTEEGMKTKNNNAVKERKKIGLGKNYQKQCSERNTGIGLQKKIKFSVAKKIMIICENTCRGWLPLS